MRYRTLIWVVVWWIAELRRVRVRGMCVFVRDASVEIIYESNRESIHEAAKERTSFFWYCVSIESSNDHR